MTTQSVAGRHVLVSGIASGREVFLGKAIDEPYQDQQTVEGKAIGLTPQGFLTAKPFTTLVRFPIRDSNCQIQQIPHPEAKSEADKLLSMSITHLQPSTFPLLYRWVESSIKREVFPSWPTNGHFFSPRRGFRPSNPFLAYIEGFMATAEQFHRVLFQSPQVTSTQELDQLSELTGNLTIELGKATNEVGTKFHQVVANETELTHYLELLADPGMPVVPTQALGGWLYVINRFEVARNWARRNGKTPLVREINALSKEGIIRVNEVILEHCSTLDTLITETCSQHGIMLEMYGEMSPFAGFTTSHRDALETTEAATPALVGAGI